jgi:hypothetical protein
MLDRKEMAPRPKKGKNGKGEKKGKKPKGPHFSRIIVATLDLDEDRVLSGDEIEDAPLSLIDLDHNEDGIISRREMKPGKPPRKEPT